MQCIVVSCDQASLEGQCYSTLSGKWINEASGQVRDRCELRMSLNASIDTQPQGLFSGFIIVATHLKVDSVSPL